MPSLGRTLRGCDDRSDFAGLQTIADALRELDARTLIATGACARPLPALAAVERNEAHAARADAFPRRGGFQGRHSARNRFVSPCTLPPRFEENASQRPFGLNIGNPSNEGSRVTATGSPPFTLTT